ncbi:MAG: hypothetical protein WKG07_50280 [Hymenobacter sp.]
MAGIVDVSSFGGYLQASTRWPWTPPACAANERDDGRAVPGLAGQQPQHRRGLHRARARTPIFIRGRGPGPARSTTWATSLCAAGRDRRARAGARRGHAALWATAVRYGAMTRNGQGETVGGGGARCSKAANSSSKSSRT